MPDAIGFTLATAFLATVFTVFGIIGRIVDGVVSEIRLTVAPAMVAGVRAWREELATSRRDGAADNDAADGTSGPFADRHDPELTIPVRSVTDRGWHLFARVMQGRLAGPVPASAQDRSSSP